MVVDKLKAITLAIEELRERRCSARGFVRGYSDCWALAQRYDYHLRGAETPFSSLKLEFTDLRSWYKCLKKHGINSIEELADFANYDLVTKKPVLGDLGLLRPMSILLAETAHWWSVNETTGKLTKQPRNPLLSEGVLVFKPRIK